MRACNPRLPGQDEVDLEVYGMNGLEGLPLHLRMHEDESTESRPKVRLSYCVGVQGKSPHRRG
jgi:hypothetical protein